MDADKEYQKKIEILREKALARMAMSAIDLPDTINDETRKLLHDLHVHQIELEMQNEELRQAHEELEHSRDRYLKLYHNAPVGYVVANSAGMVLQANKTFAHMVGKEISTLLDKPLAHLIHADDRAVYLGRFKAFYKNPAHKRLEIRIVKNDQSVMHVKLQGHRIDEVDKQWPERHGAGQILISISDITDRKRAEKELLKLRNLESIGKLAGGMAHDFNNILTAVIGHVDLAVLHTKDRKKQKFHLQGAIESAYRARDLANRLITFAEGGNQVKRAIDLPRLLEAATMLTLSGAKIAYDLDLSGDIPPLIADSDQIQAVIQNILTNAREAMPRGGKIYLGVQVVDLEHFNGHPIRHGKYTEITIRDEGIGISADDLGKIFDPYFTTKKMGDQKGIGLGLAISHSIISKHKGHIDVNSKIGMGTTVTLLLPTFTNPP